MESARPVDYFELLTGGAENLTESHWKEIVDAVVYCVGAGDDPDAAFQALESVLLECSEEWTDRRTRIIQSAETSSSNPSRRSEYCLKALRALTSEAVKEAERLGKSPELSVVERQVTDHLRKLNGDGVVHSCRLRTKQGKDTCYLWGPSQRGSGCRERQPEQHLDLVREDMPLTGAWEDLAVRPVLSNLSPTYLVTGA